MSAVITEGLHWTHIGGALANEYIFNGGRVIIIGETWKYVDESTCRRYRIQKLKYRWTAKENENGPMPFFFGEAPPIVAPVFLCLSSIIQGI